MNSPFKELQGNWNFIVIKISKFSSVKGKDIPVTGCGGP
jgi:hypothetical protein